MDEFFRLIKSLNRLIHFEMIIKDGFSTYLLPVFLFNIEFFPIFHGSHANKFIKNLSE